MNNKPVAYINVEERKLEWSKPMAWHTPTITQMNKIPLYTHPAKTLTDEEILQANLEFGKENGEDYSMLTIEDIEPLIGLVKFVLRKAQEK